MKIFTNEVKIALVAIVGLVALYLGMNFLKGFNLYSDKLGYNLVFDDIDGLTNSTTIFANGYPIGKVTDIRYDYNKQNKIEVLAKLDPELQIPVGTTAEISSDMMGNVKVVLHLALPSGKYLKPGDNIPGSVDQGAMGEISTMLPTIKQILPKLDSIATNLNKLTADPAIAQSLHNVKNISANLTTTTKQLNTLLYGLNKNVPLMMTKANNVLDNTQQFTGNLAGIDLAGTMAKVDKTLANVQEITENLNNNNGSLGLLMKDPSLYYNLNSTVANADSLVTDLKQHPKRYVHFSIFGRKDK